MAFRKFNSRQRRAYWVGVGAGLLHNENKVSSDDMLAALVEDDPTALESFANGVNRAYTVKTGDDLRSKWRRGSKTK